METIGLEVEIGIVVVGRNVCCSENENESVYVHFVDVETVIRSCCCHDGAVSKCGKVYSQDSSSL